MATLTPTLTLTSSDISSDSLALTVTDSLTVTHPFYAGGAGKLQLQTSANTVQVEYAYFTRG